VYYDTSNSVETARAITILGKLSFYTATRGWRFVRTNLHSHAAIQTILSVWTEFMLRLVQLSSVGFGDGAEALLTELFFAAPSPYCEAALAPCI
jgi:hypothetical protein